MCMRGGGVSFQYRALTLRHYVYGRVRRELVPQQVNGLRDEATLSAIVFYTIGLLL